MTVWIGGAHSAAGVLTSGHHHLECATCSIISVLTQWSATLVIQLREREIPEEEEQKGIPVFSNGARPSPTPVSCLF